MNKILCSFFVNKPNFPLKPLPLLAVMGLTTIGFTSNQAFAVEPTLVAFIGDQGVNENAQAVLQLVSDEGTDLLMIQGDFGYDDETATKWEDNLNTYLGENFPVVGTIGNHENFEWPAYKRFLSERLDRTDELSCEGDIGVKATCRFRGIEIVHVAPGINNVEGVLEQDGYPEYITNEFNDSNSIWRICSWHKNQQAMQVGAKSNETGWGVYQACLQQGAIVATGHEHSYSRTFLMSDFENQTIAHKNSTMEISQGQSFAFVSGLGGREARGQVRSDDWWASIFTGSQNAVAGALFCRFEGDTADCYFKDISGPVPDMFTLISKLGTDSTAMGGDTDTVSESVASNNNSDANTTASSSSRKSGAVGWLFLFALGVVSFTRVRLLSRSE